MSSPTLDPLTNSPVAPPRDVASSADREPHADGRLAGLALMTGCVLAALGFLAISLAVRGSGDARFTDPLWQPLYGIALAGNILVVLGLPAVLVTHSCGSRRLTLVGYVGVLAPMVMLNVSETTIEAFVKPYLARHGGVPGTDPAGLAAFEGLALLLLIVGCVCLAAAVFRAHILPRWVGVALLASVLLAFALHGDVTAFLSDYCFFAALFRFGLAAARPAN
ncbi:MAG TPA: hypothetical protein VLR26_02790 [Frankiaceae bacterium]|nr:hypothetical protein [Frankiaceae bacterium]